MCARECFRAKFKRRAHVPLRCLSIGTRPGVIHLKTSLLSRKLGLRAWKGAHLFLILLKFMVRPRAMSLATMRTFAS